MSRRRSSIFILLLPYHPRLTPSHSMVSSVFLLTLAFVGSNCALFKEETLTLKHLFGLTDPSICEIRDEGHYCKQIVIDLSLVTVAVSHRCECPNGYRCPEDVEDDKTAERCIYENDKHWHKCQLRCNPIDL
ncbi:unnamed protein product [Caenorhabditis auriculariae]|uniref:Uncharacterized protein n=1 Tax=Caenorhabditis auriculariae TaxID=2777116 RepID=A0A8S1H9C2_9PELO|nr:unnamed protein product [Caenorhabditis auriculariae]